VDRVADKRRRQLPSLARSLEGSRILLSSIAKPMPSDEWFDTHALPPWGAWLAYVHTSAWVLVSYVPTEWIAHVDRRRVRWATLDDLEAIDPLVVDIGERETSPFR